MPSKIEDALAALVAERDGLDARLAQLNGAIDALRGVVAAASPKRRRGRPPKAAAASAAAPKRKTRKPRGAGKRAASKPNKPKLEPRIVEYLAADPARESSAAEISEALGADLRGVRLSLGRMAKKGRAAKLDDGRYRAASA